MIISSDIFESFLICPSKCWYRFRREKTAGNIYSQWLHKQNQSYRKEALERLLDSVHKADYIIAPSQPVNIQRAKWRVAADFVIRKDNIETMIHAVERSSSDNKPVQLIPVRFIFSNKLSKKDKLLLAFDSLVLSEAFKHEVSHGKLIYGDRYSQARVKVSLLTREVRKSIGKIAVLIENNVPPELVLRRHCPECVFEPICRKIAIERDDLSLLAGMNEKERKKYNSKGIFTVTQLSYTFRPRRRPKRLRNKREKYHHSLKALSIRDKKIHIIGSPELKIDGTPIYLDVEGIPDNNFYYLIGLLIRDGNSLAHHSLWADGPRDEVTIWNNFLAILSSIEKPIIVHYGSYESSFLKRMNERYGGPPEESAAAGTK